MALRPRQFLFAIVLGTFAVSGSLRGLDGEAEEELKCAIIKNFVRFSTWHGTAPAANGPIMVGVLGRPSFAQALHIALDGKPVNGRPVQVVDLQSGSDLRRCSLIYFATNKNVEIKQALLAARSIHALTIGEDDRFLDYGGAVNLLLIDGRMGFEFNLEALDQAGIEISSKLLRYGQNRRRRE